MTKKVNCRIEDIPTIADFMLASVTRDLADFTAYSPLFTEAYLTDFDAKRKAATELIMTDSVNFALKTVTEKLYGELKNLRLMLVRIDGYLKLANIEVNGDRLGIKKFRLHIHKGNVEGIVLNGRNFVHNLIESKTLLATKGLKQEQIESLTTLLNTIESLNKEQNFLQSKRAQNCINNKDIFNNLWDIMWSVMQAGKAIYKGVSDAKMKDYTLAQLKKRMNNERKKAAEVEAPAEPTVEPAK